LLETATPRLTAPQRRISAFTLARRLPPKILLIRLRLIGDVIFTTPAIRAVRRAFPDASITYLVEDHAAPVVRDNPHLDRVMVIERARGWRRVIQDLTVSQQLRHQRFDIVVDFHGGPRGSFLTWASGANIRLGYEVKGRSWMYTTAVARPRELRPRHSVENQWDLLPFLSPALAGAPDRAADRTEMAANPEADERVARRLQDAGVSAAHRLIVIHVSAGNPFRRWPAGHFESLAVQLGALDPDRRIILTSGPSEVEAARQIADRARQRLGVPKGDTVLAGQEFTLTELRSLVARAALFIGGDSGPLHVASTTDVPIVGLYGPTLPVRSAPWRPEALVTEAVELTDLPCRPCDQRQCEPGDFRCLTTVAPDVVSQAAERALSRAARNRGPM
jgi:ADP-heptose:LPS heptosyltransferase